jgi:hypothetical protein
MILQTHSLLSVTSSLAHPWETLQAKGVGSTTDIGTPTLTVLNVVGGKVSGTVMGVAAGVVAGTVVGVHSVGHPTHADPVWTYTVHAIVASAGSVFGGGCGVHGVGVLGSMQLGVGQKRVVVFVKSFGGQIWGSWRSRIGRVGEDGDAEVGMLRVRELEV